MVAQRERLTLGFVGCGRATQSLHLPALQRITDWNVVAAADTDPNQLEAAASRYGIARRYSDYRGLLADAEVDAVAVCVPPRWHCEVALAALDAGKHVFVEKPVALSPEECDRLAKAAARSPRKLMVGFNLRWHRHVRRARQIVQQGVLGPVELIRTALTGRIHQRTQASSWSNRREEGGGVLFELGVHHFDLWRHLTDCEVEEVCAVSQSAEGADRGAVVGARLTSGVLATSLLGQGTSETNEIEIYGPRGGLRISCYRFDGIEFIPAASVAGGMRNRWRRIVNTLRELPRAALESRHGGCFHSTYRDEWRHFAEAIRNDTSVGSTLQDGRRALEVTLAAIASAAQARRVSLSDSPPEVAPLAGAQTGSL